VTFRFVLPAAVAAALVLAGCARPGPAPPPTEIDPAAAQALFAPILTDPDLVSLDPRFAVLSVPAPLEGSLPPDDFAPSTMAAARAEAAAMTRGSAGSEIAGGGRCDGCGEVLLADRARVLGRSCAAGLEDDFEWALRLPGDLPVYPRSHLREAVGREGVACNVRGASFTAPAPASEVLAFYRAVAAKAGYRLRGAGGQGFTGLRGASRIAVLVRQQPGGLAHFDLIVSS
jgi:hypothetical protein